MTERGADRDDEVDSSLSGDGGAETEGCFVAIVNGRRFVLFAAPVVLPVVSEALLADAVCALSTRGRGESPGGGGPGGGG